MPLVKLSLLAILVGFFIATPALSAEQWVELFSGKDLAGWRPITQPEAFRVVDGAIRAPAAVMMSQELHA